MNGQRQYGKKPYNDRRPAGGSQKQQPATAKVASLEFPLPSATAAAVKKVLSQSSCGCANPGLILQKYIGVENIKDCTLKGAARKDFMVDKIARSLQQQDMESLLPLVTARWHKMLEGLKRAGFHVEDFTARTRGRLVVGLGTASTLETGMTMHPVYGFPCIPGSSLKGMARACAEEKMGPGRPSINDIFGPEDAGEDKASRGRVIFFDAMPADVPQLEVDIINCHYGDYYMNDAPPADWLSPVPVYFLTVKRGTRFHFAVASPDSELARRAKEWLSQGLTSLGIGSKTMVGYGRFDADPAGAQH